jgi:hypothetical protein
MRMLNFLFWGCGFILLVTVSYWFALLAPVVIFGFGICDYCIENKGIKHNLIYYFRCRHKGHEYRKTHPLYPATLCKYCGEDRTIKT